MTDAWNLELLELFEAGDREILQLSQRPDHLDIVAFGCEPTPRNPDGIYLYVDRLRAFTDLGINVNDLHFHLNRVTELDRTYFLDRAAGYIDAYASILFPYADYARLPTWYKAIALGLPAMGLADWALLNRKGFLKKTAAGVTLLAAGAIAEALVNIPRVVGNAVSANARRRYEALSSALYLRSVNASFFERDVLPQRGEPEDFIKRDRLTTPHDPFPEILFRGLALMVADAVANHGVLTSGDLRFYGAAFKRTRHFHPQYMPVSDHVLRELRAGGG